mgnify:CR=1 FL=1
MHLGGSLPEKPCRLEIGPNKFGGCYCDLLIGEREYRPTSASQVPDDGYSLGQAMKKLKVDNALKSGTQVGPVVDQKQLDQDLRYLEIGMNPEWLRYYYAAKLGPRTAGVDYLYPRRRPGSARS